MTDCKSMSAGEARGTTAPALGFQFVLHGDTDTISGREEDRYEMNETGGNGDSTKVEGEKSIFYRKKF